MTRDQPGPARTMASREVSTVRRFIAIGALALLVLAVVPLTSAGTSVPTKHVDGSVRVYETAREGGPTSDREWLARFEVRTTSGKVDFGHFELYGITKDGTTPNAGEIHVFEVTGVDYFRAPTGAQGATLHMTECLMFEPYTCADSDYVVSDGGANDTFMEFLGWTVESGNISIYTTGGQNQQ